MSITTWINEAVERSNAAQIVAPNEDDLDAEAHAQDEADDAAVELARTDLPFALMALRAVDDLCKADEEGPKRGEITVAELREVITNALAGRECFVCGESGSNLLAFAGGVFVHATTCAREYQG